MINHLINHWTLPILALLKGDRSTPTIAIAESCQDYANRSTVNIYPWGEKPKDSIRPQL